MIDPIVDEIRQFREEHAQSFHGDLETICEDLRKIQQEYEHPVVTFPPKRLHQDTASLTEQENIEKAAA
jgi:hypothetical protein